MQRLPHLALEEIDAIDLPRYMRVWEAQELARAARTVRDWLAGQLPYSAVQALDEDLVREVTDDG